MSIRSRFIPSAFAVSLFVWAVILGILALSCAPVNAQQVVTQTFTYVAPNPNANPPVTGYQSFVVPKGVTSLTVKLWGAGGGGSTGGAGGGGGGAYVTATFTVVTGENLVILVGGGGTGGSSSTGSSAFGGGGTGPSGAGGGGRSAIFINSVNELVDAGAGGGGGQGVPGGAGGIAAGAPGTGNGVSSGGGGGTQTGGGGGAAGGSPGTQYTGGDGNGGSGGGGGSGYYGGGGSGADYLGGVAGGGGSSYTGNSMLTNVTGLPGSGTAAGGESDPDYIAGVGIGSASAAGGNGEVVISYTGPPVPNYHLLWQGVQTGNVNGWTMNLAAQVGPGTDVSNGVTLTWKIVGTGKFSGGATPDILWQNESTGEVGIWRMNGLTLLYYTQITPPGVVAPGSGWQIAGAGTFSGAANPDILWENTNTGEVGYWQMTGTDFVTYVQVETPGTVGAAWRIVGAPNLLGGHRPQILWQNTETGEIGYWVYDPGFSTWGDYTRIEAPGVVSPVWHVGATPDILGSGTDDVVWQNETTGEIGYWLMGDGQRKSYTQIAAPGVVLPSVWQLRAGF